jgi:cytochrome P450
VRTDTSTNTGVEANTHFDVPPISNFDHLDPSLPPRLFTTYKTMRDECPVARGDSFGGFWVLTRYEDVVAALKNHRVFSNAHGVTIPHLGNLVPAIPTESDQPRHTVYRNSLMPFMTPGEVKKMEPFIRSLVGRLIDEVIEAGQCDVLTAFAEPVPGLVVGRLLGYSEQDAMQCVAWTAELFEAGGEGDLATQAARAQDIIGFLQSEVEDRRERPRGPDDVITFLVRFEDSAGDRFTNDEIIGLLFTSTLGAVETTVNTIGHLLHHVGRLPEVKAQLLANPSLCDRAVEEALRIDAPSQQDARTVVEPIDVHGYSFQPGDRLMNCWGSANRDERVFADPDSFRLDRDSNPHLSFGHGIHKCAGMHLARLEVRVVLEEVLSRMPDFEVIESTGPSLTGGISWHMDSVVIKYTPGTRRDSSDPDSKETE